MQRVLVGRSVLVGPRETARVRSAMRGHAGHQRREIRRAEGKTFDQMNRELLDWTEDHSFYIQRFTFLVGSRCRIMTSKDVAEETR